MAYYLQTETDSIYTAVISAVSWELMAPSVSKYKSFLAMFQSVSRFIVRNAYIFGRRANSSEHANASAAPAVNTTWCVE
jgi:hypothetical protein